LVYHDLNSYRFRSTGDTLCCCVVEYVMMSWLVTLLTLRYV